MISVVQNFICTMPKRLSVLEREMPKMGEVFKDYDFYVNYNTDKNFNEFLEIYNNNVKKLSFYNNLEQNWGLVTLSMLKKIKTEYTLILCEDFEYRMTYEEWKTILSEFVNNNCGYMPLGRLWKYTKEEYWGGYISGDKLWFYEAKNSPGTSLSVDALYRTKDLIEKLEELQNYDSRRFPLNLPHHFEDIFHEPNGVTKFDTMLCAVPKDIIIMHEQDETETTLNK